jgi:hypothetical protein
MKTLLRAAMLLALAGCSSPIEPPAKGPSNDLPEWQRAVFPPPETAEDRAGAETLRAGAEAFRAAVIAACPSPPAGSDDLPGISPAARYVRNHLGRGCRLGGMTFEVTELERLHSAIPKTHPDHANLLDRLAGAYFLLEMDAYGACTSLSLPEEVSARALRDRNAELARLVKLYRGSREKGYALCDELAAEHPERAAPSHCLAR